MKIRVPRPSEADALTDLCKRSKASWGYDGAFMAASAEALTVTPQRLDDEVFWVAEDEGRLLGVVAVLETELGWELDLLFVEPDLKRGGVGRVLLDRAARHLRAMSVDRVMIQSDPYAEGFYLRCGAERVGEVESESLPGRMLPLLALKL